VVHPQDVSNLFPIENDQNWWYSIASPWGNPVLSPRDIASVFYHGRRINPAFVETGGNEPVRPGMDAGTDMVVYEPAFLDRVYAIDTRVADKWQTEKTAFTSTEYSLTDKITGRLVAVVRKYGALILKRQPAVE
jgi:hypothetical protein